MHKDITVYPPTKTLFLSLRGQMDESQNFGRSVTDYGRIVHLVDESCGRHERSLRRSNAGRLQILRRSKRSQKATTTCESISHLEMNWASRETPSCKSREVEMAGVVKTDHSRDFCWRWIVTVLGLVSVGNTQGINFDVHEHECWVHETEAESEFVKMFVEIVRDVNPGPFRHMGVDVVIQAPGGQYIHTEKVKDEVIPDVRTHGADINTKFAKYEASINFTAVEKGRYNICFHNRGNVVETVRLDIFDELDVDREEPVKDVHIRPLMDQMASLSDALVDVEFEQDWLASHTDRHASILSDLSKRVVYKAMLEAFAFIACSVLQVVVIQRLLHKHLAGKQH